MAIIPLYKVKGHNPEAADWFWVKHEQNGKALNPFKIKGCLDCYRTKEA